VIERNAALRHRPDATHWSIRSMAVENWLFPHHDPPNVVGVRLTAATVAQTFKLSSDPLFVDKVRDIVGPLPIPTEPSPCPQHR